MNIRRHITFMLGTLGLAAILLSTHGAAGAQALPHTYYTPSQYQFQLISNPADPTFTQLLGINDHQVIAGYYGSGQTVNGVLHPNQGFTLTLPNSFTAENYPNAMQTQVIGINNNGVTGGFYIDAAGNTHGFMKDNGTFATIDLPGTTFNQILGLNNRRQAASYFQDAAQQNHAYVREANGAFLVLPLVNSQATAINDFGTVVGFTQLTTTTSSAFIMRGDDVSIFNVPGSSFTQALGENDLGQVVGTYNDAQGNGHGFTYRNGHFLTVDVPGASATVVNGINNSNCSELGEGRFLTEQGEAFPKGIEATGAPGAAEAE